MHKKTVVGLEIHMQLHTESKMFCGCSTKADVPNSSVCETCLGMPGSKPRLNKKALDYALKVALALNCTVNREFFFSRKTYFYPDMAKNFQISQYEIPVGKEGFLALDSGKKVKINRVHLEEDPAALVHGEGVSASAYCLVDYNRSGIPLVEIVTAPDMESPAEAREFLNKLLNLLQYLEVFVLGEDVLKCDSNISIEGSERVEVKNVSGFRNVERALAFEEGRQKRLLSEGENIPRETRGFNEADGTTFSMRAKEEEEDYGYIFEPDLTAIEVSDEWLHEIRRQLPELPEEKARRFVKDYIIPDYDAKVICFDYGISKLYEEVAKESDPALAAKLVTREIMGILNYNDLSLKNSGMEAKPIVELLKLIEAGKVGDKNTKESLIKYALEKMKPADFLENNNLLKDLGEDEVIKAIDSVLKTHASAISDYKNSPEKVLNFLTGHVMRLTKGKAEARFVQRVIKERLGKQEG